MSHRAALFLLGLRKKLLYKVVYSGGWHCQGFRRERCTVPARNGLFERSEFPFLVEMHCTVANRKHDTPDLGANHLRYISILSPCDEPRHSTPPFASFFTSPLLG